MTETDTITSKIQERIQAVRAEITRLEKAARALDGGQRRRRVGSGTKVVAANGRRRGRRRRSGKRAEEALKAVQAHPGITISELAREMRIQPNYLYRVMPTLQAAKKVKKRGKGWHPA